ncbi:transposase [Streptomyces chartreusis]|uniref:transposase n=1 Tax=Streptomyces chartreusis TaxID=1969 RepID=UPI0037FFF5DF
MRTQAPSRRYPPRLRDAPEVLGLLGVGLITAAQVLVGWSHSGRFMSEEAFASFAGVSPIPASSGLTTPATDQSQWRPAAQPGLTRDHADPDPAGRGHENVRRPQSRRGPDLSRRPAVPQACHLPTALQDPRTPQSRHRSES